MNKKLVASELIKVAQSLLAADDSLTNTGNKPLSPIKLKSMKDKELGLVLMDWHGGGGSGVYSVGSTIHVGEAPEKQQVERAIKELMNLKKDARYPETVTHGDEVETRNLANELKRRYL